MTEKEKFSKEEYLQVLELFFEAVQSLKGKLIQDGRIPDCQDLALKLYAHATSAYWLSLGTRAPVPKSTNGSSFTDFGSIAVIVRVALETYLTFFEVYVDPKSDDEFEFNYCLWHLSGRILQENFIPSDPSLIEEIRVAKKEISELRKRLQKTILFSSRTKSQQKDILKGKRRRTWEDLAKNAGFGFSFLRRTYLYYSSYVHADALSASQLMNAQSKEEQDLYTEIHLRIILIVMSKMILNYSEKFPEAAIACERFPDAYARTKIWSEVITRIP